MKKRICQTAATAAFLVMFHSAPAQAGFSNNNLREFCRAAVKMFDEQSVDITTDAKGKMCIAYIQGYYYGWLDARLYVNTNPQNKLASNTDIDICFPETEEMHQAFTFDQLIRIFIKWIEDNPERLHHDASTGLRSSWGHAFPCPPKK